MFIFLFSFIYADENNGKVLYTEAECAKCHTPDIFTHEDRKIKSYEKLEKQVKWCGYKNDAPWFDDEALDVVKYLNHHYYKFPTQK